LLEHERIALAMIALITGMMAFIESMIAVPAGSTALAADALSFVQHSVSAGFALRAASGLKRHRWMVVVQGAVMMLLGALVCAIAVRRLFIGSFPHPVAMIVMGLIALVAHLSACAIMLHSRGQLKSLEALWRFARNDAVGNISVIAAAGAVAATRSNIPDLVIGAAMAGFFVISGWRVMTTGNADANQLR
jgi:Co/Zn/Cd efflux system component